MALTITEVKNPNSIISEFPVFDRKGRIVDVTFDSSYPTGGEILTARQLGWHVITGVIPLTLASTASGTTALAVSGHPASPAQDSVALRLFESATAGNPMAEIGSGDNVSTFTVRLLVLGN